MPARSNGISRLFLQSGASLLVVVLLCVPTLTRVTQRLESRTTVKNSIGFNRGSDHPPNKVSLSLVAVPSSVRCLDARRSVGGCHVAEPLWDTSATSAPSLPRAPPDASHT